MLGDEYVEITYYLINVDVWMYCFDNAICGDIWRICRV